MLQFILLVTLTAVLYGSDQASGQTKRVMCYYTNWSQYRPNYGKFYPENVDPHLCTHLIYTFATLAGHLMKPFEWNDDSTTWSKGMYDRAISLKTINPALKIILGVGGWNLGSAPFSQLVANPSYIRDFANNAVAFLRQRGFDGLELDWEYPANRGGEPADKHEFTELVKTMAQAFHDESVRTGQSRLLLSSAVAAGKSTIDSAYDIPEISQYLDFVNVMAYDLHGSWESRTGHNSPLYGRPDETGDDVYLNLAWAANYWVQRGAPKDKINIGVPTYGRSFTLTNSYHHDVGSPASGPGDAGPETREAGFLAYYEICDMIRAGGVVHPIPEQRVRYVEYNNQWVGFDDPDSLREKMCFLKLNGFGGAMVWAIDLDDFNGQKCGLGKYPLLHAIHDELLNPDISHCATPGPTVSPPNYPTTPSMVWSSTQQVVWPTRITHITQVNPNDFYCGDKPSDFYPSPYTCTEYYICANFVSYRVLCAEGLHFNPATKYCDWPQNSHCSISVTNAPVIHPSLTFPTWTPPQFTRPPMTIPPGTISPDGSNKIATFCLNKPNGYYRDTADCHHYYQCAFTLTFRVPCEPGLVYNEAIQTCDINTACIVV